jgi:hypothetical protein
LQTTETDDRLIASAAIIGDSSSPVHGYRRPAAVLVQWRQEKASQSAALISQSS